MKRRLYQNLGVLRTARRTYIEYCTSTNQRCAKEGNNHHSGSTGQRQLISEIAFLVGNFQRGERSSLSRTSCMINLYRARLCIEVVAVRSLGFHNAILGRSKDMPGGLIALFIGVVPIGRHMQTAEGGLIFAGFGIVYWFYGNGISGTPLYRIVHFVPNL